MTPRAIRRAAERKAKKLAAKATKIMTASVGSVINNENETTVTVHDDFRADHINLSEERRHISEAKRLANQQNGRLSHGPKTEAGRRASSMNAISHGLTAKAALMLGDDPEDYQDLVDSHFARYSPVSDEECELVNSIADTAWRLLKVPIREAAMYEVGRMQHPGLYFNEIEDNARREAMADAKIAMLYEKDFRNLYLQERRLRNQHKADIARLKEVQQERIDKPKREAQAAAEENIRQVTRAENIEKQCRTHNKPFNPSDFGFNFSTSEWRHYIDRNNTHYLLCKEYLDLEKVIAAFRASQDPPQAA
jgi:hypothetical protein